MTTTTDLIHLSDEWLAWAIAHGSEGDQNSAPHFMMLPTIELRQRAWRDAHYTRNCVGGRWSSAVETAVAAMIRNGFDTPTSAEERVEREERGL